MRLFSVYFAVIISICMNRFHAYQGEFDNQLDYEYTINNNAIGFDEDAYIKELEAVRNDSTGYPDPINGRLLDNWDPASGVRAHEIGNYYQGDILHVPDTSGRSGLIGNQYRWPNRIVYYRIAPTFTANDYNRIMYAINEYNTKTCLRFVQAGPTTRDFIYVTNTYAGCFATIGRAGGAQQLNLQVPGCVYYSGTIIHEFMHAVGFFHEQARIDRDQYVQIFPQNIVPGNESQFFIARNSFHYNLPYDYSSVMHYSEYTFSRNNQPTILPRQRNIKLGNDIGFTNTDLQKIRLMYGC